MKVKNISKKIIGNQSFRLLPGKTMEVQGDELWVRDYTAEKKLETVAADEEAADHSLPPTTQEAGRMNDGSGQDGSGSGQPDGGGGQDESKEDEAKATAKGRKK